MSEIDLNSVKTAHFIGIGGIGISAIARLLLLQGVTVSGSDRDGSKVTDELVRAGVQVSMGHVAANIPEHCDCVIYTVAIPTDNPELVEAKKRGIPLLTYPQTLDFVSRQKFTIAIAGTHGKTTTTAMVGSVLLDAGLDPTVIVGSLMKRPDGTESNFIAGKSKYLVVEADEYKKSFHNLHPKILVINNLDEDHLDFYKDLADIQNAFIELAVRVPTDGVLICNISDPHLAPILKKVKCKVVDYKACTLSVTLKVPGAHNRSNAQVALAVADALHIPKGTVEKTLGSFTGVWRRFEYKGTTKAGIRIYDDYAHNPQKVKAALAGAREYFGNKTRIIGIFQPHLFSRTKLLLKEFAGAFGDADVIILAPIYPAREVFDPTISSDMLAQEILQKIGNNKIVVSLQSFGDIESYVRNLLTKDDVVLTIGAGDVYKIGESLLDKKS